MPPLTVDPRASIKLPGAVLRGHPFSGAMAASGAGCSGAVAAPLPCGPVPALKLRHCHTTTLSRGTSAPATCRQPSSSAVQSGGARALAAPVPWRRPCPGGARALAALPAVTKIHKVRRSRQVCHCCGFPILSGGTPYKSAALVFSQSPQPIHCRHIGHVSISFYISTKSAKSAGRIMWFIHCHVLLIPIKSDDLPYRAAASRQNSRKYAKSAGRTSSHIPGFNAILAPHTVWRPPIRRRRFPRLTHLPIRFRGLPYDSAASNTQAAFHTVSRFPHTTTRLTHFPIRFPRIHHTIRKLQGIRPQIRRGQLPGVALAPPACMRASARTRAPACMRAPSRVWAHLHGRARLYVRACLHCHGRMPVMFATTLAYRIRLTPYLHCTAITQWYGSMVICPWHAFMSILTSPGTLPTRPARTAYADPRIRPTHSNSLGGMGVMVRRRLATTTGGGGQHVCVIGPKGPITVKP